MDGSNPQDVLKVIRDESGKTDKKAVYLGTRIIN
jgi:uridylate kinase